MSESRQISGPWLVAGMFLFASLVTAGLWGYWEFHTRPFRPLSDALGAKYPESNPRVEGGKHGMHKQTARRLRIVLRVPYDPFKQELEFQQQANEILQLADQLEQLDRFDACEIHLFQQRPEQPPILRSIEIPAAEFPQESANAASLPDDALR